MRAREPDASGFVERDGVRPPLRGLRRRGADRDAAAGVVDRPLESVESADPVPCPPLPGRHVRRAWVWSIRPPGRRCGVHPRAIRRRHSRSPRSNRDRPAVLIGLSAGARWGVQLAGEYPDRVLGFVAIARPPHWFPTIQIAPLSHSTTRSSRRGWAKFNSHYWEHDYPGVRRVLHRPDVHRNALDEADRGRGRWGLEIDRPRSRTPSGNPVTDPNAFREACARVSCPVLVIHGDEDAVRPHAAGVALAEVTRPVGDDRRGRTRPQRPRSRRRQPVDPRVRRVGRSARQGRTPMTAREPDASGFVERGAVRVWWERFGEGDPAILFFGGDAIVSRGCGRRSPHSPLSQRAPIAPTVL